MPDDHVRQAEIDEPIDEVERYELRESQAYWFAANRREFAQSVGAGLLMVATAKVSRGQGRGQTARREELLSERFHVSVDGIVSVLTSKVEVGQGARTQIAQAAAEELHVPVDHIRLIMADTQLCPDDGGTAGSRTTPSTVPRVRSAAAALRELLIKYAAEQLGEPTENVAFRDGLFAANDRQLTLAQLISDEQWQQKLQVAPPLQGVPVVPVAEWQVLGQAVPKLGGAEIVTGAAQYPSDIQRPGMLYGKVLRPASYGAQLKSIDLTLPEELGKVVVVRDGNFIGCAAANSWQASRALDAIAATCEWDRPQQPASQELFEHLKQTASQDNGRSQPDNRQPVATTFANARHQLDCRYTIAYIQHAPMEPRAAVAEWQAGQLTVWTGTQQPARVQGELCDAFRLAAEQVRVIVPDTGGGFGGKHTGEAAVEAARLAKAADRPVSLRWTREEEFSWAYFRPAGLIEVQAGLDSAGRLMHWDFTNYNSGRSAIETPYEVPNARARFLTSDSPLRQGSYRALASTANTFARESAMDELAHLAELDPLEFRLRHLAEGRLKDVLKSAAEKFEWSRRRAHPAQGRGVGLACGTEKGSFVAACVEVEVVDGKLHVLEVCQAYECGAVHNPVNLRAQQAGALIMGLGGALWEAIEFANGQVTNASFSAYRVPRLSDLPKLELVQLDRRDLPSVGAGETPIIAIAPAIANAVHQACGVRSRSMPLKLDA